MCYREVDHTMWERDGDRDIEGVRRYNQIVIEGERGKEGERKSNG